MPTLKPDPATDFCGCGARRPFGEPCCADCRDLDDTVRGYQVAFVEALHGETPARDCIAGDRQGRA